MYCDECKKKPATVHLTQMFNGQTTEAHYCEECAAKKGAVIFNMGSSFSIPNMLASFFGYNMEGLPAPSAARTCDNCGMNFNDIRQSGKLGCSECYAAFDEQLEPTLRGMHGNSQHIGKVPARGGEKVILKKKVEDMKGRLQQAVAEEDYEKAAQIRDAIKELEKKLG